MLSFVSPSGELIWPIIFPSLSKSNHPMLSLLFRRSRFELDWFAFSLYSPIAESTSPKSVGDYGFLPATLRLFSLPGIVCSHHTAAYFYAIKTILPVSSWISLLNLALSEFPSLKCSSHISRTRERSFAFKNSFTFSRLK
jgi:hypothetical protein